MIVSGNLDSYDAHVQASMAFDGSYALVYSVIDVPYTINLSKMSSPIISGIWYHPRSNRYRSENIIRISDKRTPKEVDPPGEKGAGNDWVLILGNEQTINNYQYGTVANKK